MPTPHINLELGKLMATVEALQKQMVDLKKDMQGLNSQIGKVHTELLNFMGTVQTKSACALLHDSLAKTYIQRTEIAPLKALVSTISITTVTAICVAFLNLILK